jgi:hypothetical protein
MTALVSSSTWPAMLAEALDKIERGEVETFTFASLGPFGKSAALDLLIPMIEERGLEVVLSVRPHSLVIIRA